MDWPLFMGVPEEKVRATLAGARSRRFERGEVLFHEGDRGASLSLVLKGHFGMRVLSELGEAALFRVYGPGEMFGRTEMGVGGAVRAATMVALDAGAIIEIYPEVLHALRAEHPSVNDALLMIMAQHLQWVSERLVEAYYVDAERRLRRRLLGLREMYTEDDSDRPVVITLTQEDLAGLAGTSRGTANRVLGEEESLGTIRRRRGGIELLDPQGLAERAA